MHKTFFLLLSFLFGFTVLSQKQLAELPSELAESSALIKYGDLFLTVNDSGNEPIVFAFDVKGKMVHSCKLLNAKNTDWEALAYDGKNHLYIGDTGNNKNKRKQLTIYKVEVESLLKEKQIEAEKITYSYPEQTDFPPKKSEMYYDAEALFYQNGNLIVVTKNRSVPFDGKAFLYQIPAKSGAYKAKRIGEISLGATHWMENSVTDAAFYKEETLYLLTYSKIYKFVWKNNSFHQEGDIDLDNITQKEGITVDDKYIYLTDENDFQLFKHNYLYRLKRF